MFELKIADINLIMSIQDFKTEFQDAIDDYNTSYGTDMEYAIKQMSTKMGKHMYKIIADNNNGSDIDIIAERDDVTGNINFHPLKLSNMNESFYKTHYDDYNIIGQDEDPGMLIAQSFEHICTKYKGSFACIKPNGNVCIIKDGNSKRLSSFALIDTDNNVYSCAGAKSVKGASEDASFSVKKPIGEWLNENLDIQREIAKLPAMDAKMNYIGKYLINARIKEEIDSDEFTDIFCQAGIIGFSEPSVLNIYKLIM